MLLQNFKLKNKSELKTEFNQNISNKSFRHNQNISNKSELKTEY